MKKRHVNYKLTAGHSLLIATGTDPDVPFLWFGSTEHGQYYGLVMGKGELKKLIKMAEITLKRVETLERTK